MDNRNNKKSNVSMQHIIRDVSTMGINALVHAAELSPINHGRSIGVDRNFYTQTIICDNNANKNDLLTADELKGMFHYNPTNHHSEIDYYTLRYSILFKNAEQNRKRLVKREIKKNEEMHQTQLEKKKREITERIYNEKECFFKNRIESDKEILKEVNKLENSANAELVNNQYENNYSNTKLSLKGILDNLVEREKLKQIISKEQNEIIVSNLPKQEILLSNDLSVVKDTENLPKVTYTQNHIASEVPKKLIPLNDSDLSKNSDLITPKNSDLVDAVSNIKVESQNHTQNKIIPKINFVTEERLKFYNNIMMIYNAKSERSDKLQNDDNAKEYRALYRQAIYTPINAIGSVSAQHLRDKYEKLLRFMTGQPYTTVKGTITINSHPLGPDFCVMLIVKKFVNQGENSIASNPQSAYAFASVAISLWKKIPDFGNLLLAHFFKKSPFLVPYFIPEKKDQSVEDYCKLVGYYITDGQIEDQTKYLTRLSGLIRLYSALMITAGTNVDGSDHPFSIENGWQWLCDILNLFPLPDICATLILEFLQTAGWAMSAKYGKQFNKLLYLIQYQYFPKLAEIDQGGPKARLEVLLTKLLSNKQVPQPVGLLSPNFW